MTIKTHRILILILLGSATGQDDEKAKNLTSSSEEFQRYLEDQKITLDSGNPYHKSAKEIFKKQMKLERKLNAAEKELTSLETDVFEKDQLLPHLDLICAVDYMRTDVSLIFNHVAGIAYITAPTLPWPPRIQDIRDRYDDYLKGKKGKMYPSPAMQRQDDENYNKWLHYVSTAPSVLYFANKDRVEYDEWKNRIEKYRKVAANLQAHLQDYYKNLDNKLKKELYDLSDTNFKKDFAAIIQRGYRFSRYFFDSLHDRILSDIQRKFSNETDVFLEEAVFRMDPAWYFVQEHIQMYNILINATEKRDQKKHFMFASANVTHLDIELVIPGKKGCVKSKFVTTYNRKYYTPTTIQQSIH